MYRRQHFRDLLAQQLQRDDAALELDRAALYLAGEEYPGLDVDACLAELDALAAGARARAGGARDQQGLADALNRQLFDHLGFSGNAEDYYNPDNSYLNRVLETRRGIPITLSVLYMEVGRRLGLACHGVGLPGHFLVGIDALELYLDPFHGGKLLSAADCRRLLGDLFGPGTPWHEGYLRPARKRDILFRMLTNLKQTFLHAGDYPRAIAAIQRMVLVNPAASSLHKELAWCHFQLKEFRLAIQDLEMYLQAAESPADAENVRQQIQVLRAEISQRN